MSGPFEKDASGRDEADTEYASALCKAGRKTTRLAEFDPAKNFASANSAQWASIRSAAQPNGLEIALWTAMDVETSDS
jgi:hypothetical protein